MKLSGTWHEKWNRCTPLHLVRSSQCIHSTVLTVFYILARGDKKKALERLRTSTSPKTHHFSTFRSGLLIGFAISALIDGLGKGQYFWAAITRVASWLFLVFQPETQQAIPCWDILLFIYGLIFVPVLYSFLVGFNLLMWAKSRINYVFIFGKDEEILSWQCYSSNVSPLIRFEWPKPPWSSTVFRGRLPWSEFWLLLWYIKLLDIDTKPASRDIVLHVLAFFFSHWCPESTTLNFSAFVADFCGFPYGQPHTRYGQIVTFLVDQEYLEAIPLWNSTGRGSCFLYLSYFGTILTLGL